MKIRKGILSVLIIALSMIIFGLNSSVNAETAEQPLNLGLEQYRSSGYSYKAIEKVMWKIASYDENGSNPNMSKTLYCIKAGPGFGSTDMGGSYVGAVTVRPYTQKFDLKNLSTITGNYLKALPSGQNYNSLVWVLEHCYIPGLSTSAQYRKELLAAANIPNSKMTDDEIDIAQQFAIWYFTNEDEYKLKEGTFYYYVKEKADANYIAIGDKFTNGDDRNDDAITLFNYLIEQGIANASTKPKQNNMLAPISIDSTNGKIVLDGNNYILGPYTLNEQADIEYTLTSTTLKNGNTDVLFKILNKDKVETNIQDVVGKDFYISVDKDIYASGLKLTVTAKTYETLLTYWSVNNAPENDQPVVEIDRKEQSYYAEIITPNIPEEKTFDLALRKFITKIGNTPVTVSRVPDITNENLAKLANNGTWTVTKIHTKQPLQVKNSDTVLYTIRIYNEGELDGYATEVTDYLPIGLKLKENSTINIQYGWSNPSGDGKTIVTDKLSTRLLKAFDGTTLDYADLEVECVIDAKDSTQNQYLKNVAEITAQTDSEGNQITDRDSRS